METLLDRVCETVPTLPALIMEPLRRPAIVERRRVPPIRIRLPRQREQRERRSSRSRKYSPPLPVSRQQAAHLSESTGEGTSSAPSRYVRWMQQTISYFFDDCLVIFLGVKT